MFDETIAKVVGIISGPAITGLIELIKLWVKPTGVWIRICALMLGVIAGCIGAMTSGATGWEGWLMWLLVGLLEGLVSTGLYEQLKKIGNQSPPPPAV